MPAITINPLFKFGQIVYIITDPDQLECIVIGYFVEAGGLILYKVRAGDYEPSLHSAVELSKKKLNKIVPLEPEEDD